MTTLDQTAVNAAKQTFGDALSWGADPQDALSSALSAFADALSSLPAQAVTVKALDKVREAHRFLAAASVASCECGAKSPDLRNHVEGCRYRNIASAMESLEAALAPSQPAAVGEEQSS